MKIKFSFFLRRQTLFFMFKFRKNQGFTLIELLVVIAIIGVLASVVLASLNTARKKSRDARRIADIKQIQLALELSFDSASPNTYPATLAALQTGGFIPVVPNDPLSAAYTYNQCSSTLYHLGAALEDSANQALTGDLNGQPAGCTPVWGLDAGVCSGTAGINQGSYCYDVAP